MPRLRPLSRCNGRDTYQVEAAFKVRCNMLISNGLLGWIANPPLLHRRRHAVVIVGRKYIISQDIITQPRRITMSILSLIALYRQQGTCELCS